MIIAKLPIWARLVALLIPDPPTIMVAVSEVVPLADDEGRSVADACVADEAGEEEEGAAAEDEATWT